MGTSSGITLAKLVMAAIELPVSQHRNDNFVEVPVSLLTTPTSLPPRRVANHIFEAYEVLPALLALFHIPKSAYIQRAFRLCI
jgi:hypothetical protein